MNKLVSVIIPIYNVDKFLFDSIDSVCKQSYKSLEIILVNDGSTDNSPQICDELAKNDERIIVLHKENGGLSSARNAGINIAKGDYIFFLDGDDFIEKETIKILVDRINSNMKIGIVSAPCFLSYKDGKCNIFRDEWNIRSIRIINYESLFLKSLLQEICFSACCKLYKKKLFENLRFREGKRNEDTLFMFDISHVMEDMQLNMLEIPNKLYYYRVNQGSITRDISHPLQFYYVENLQLLITESKKETLTKILKTIFYKELISLKIISLKKSNEIKSNILQQSNQIFKNVSMLDLIKNSKCINIIKYLILKYIPFVYLLKFKVAKKK